MKNGTLKKERTSEKAETETEAAAGADAEGGTHLAKVVGLHHRKLPQQTLVPVAVHPSLFSVCDDTTRGRGEMKAERNKQEIILLCSCLPNYSNLLV